MCNISQNIANDIIHSTTMVSSYSVLIKFIYKVYTSRKTFKFIAECLSMRHIILGGRRVPTVEYAACVYIYIFIGLFGSTVQSTELMDLIPYSFAPLILFLILYTLNLLS